MLKKNMSLSLVYGISFLILNIVSFHNIIIIIVIKYIK